MGSEMCIRDRSNIPGGGGRRPPPPGVSAGVSGSFPGAFRAGLRRAFLAGACIERCFYPRLYFIAFRRVDARVRIAFRRVDSNRSLFRISYSVFRPCSVVRIPRSVFRPCSVQAGGRIRNSCFRLRVWMSNGRFGAVLKHLGGPRPSKVGGLRPPTLLATCGFAPSNDFLIFDLKKFVF